MIDEDFFWTLTPCCTTADGQLRHREVHAVLHLHLRDVGSVSSEKYTVIVSWPVELLIDDM
jgi:hypothetical protein